MAFALVESSSSSSGGGGTHLPLPSSHLYDITSGEGEDADDFLEDAGFFGTADGATRPLSGPKSLLEGGGMSVSMSNESSPQKALDELFRKPTSFGSMLDDEGEGEEEPFDLDRMIEMEREEQEPPEDYADEDEELRNEEPPEDEEDERDPHIGGMEEDEDDDEEGGVLESNGFLDSSSVKTRANDTTKSTPVTSIRTVARQSVVMREEASTSAARLARTEVVEVEDKEDEDEDEELERDRGPVGMNGIPKYLPVGLATATLLDGGVVRFEKRRRMKAYKPKPVHYGAGPTGLLSRPVHHIVDSILAKNAAAVVDRDEDLASSKAKGKIKKPTTRMEMWQERYRPKRFTELVGEERTHREVMAWLKDWDACVFGRKNRLMNKRKKMIAAAQPQSGTGMDRFAPVPDKWGRPKERVLLLGGPAGMGKTTLAHVVANACGYLVHELNASDDRSTSTVEDRVREALETKSLMGGSAMEKPTCLVLDEIDGATGGRGDEGGGFIKALVKLVERGAGSSNGARSKSKKQKHRPLLRPIICICNDPYAPSLRALRPHSKLIRVNRPASNHLVARLKAICTNETIETDTRSLSLLVQLCQGDIRSCLNALQLVKANSAGPLARLLASDLRTSSSEDGDASNPVAAALGVKDGSTSIHMVWSQLFRAPSPKERARQSGPGRLDEAGQTSKLVQTIMGSGDMDKVLAGCFEHYPNLSPPDEGWWRFSKAHEWIHWFETLNNKGWELSGGTSELWQYLPWSFVIWKRLFANTSNALPEYPRVDYQNYLKRSAFDEVTRDLLGCLPAVTRTQFGELAIVTELGPTLMRMLSPDLKMINSQLVRHEERSTLQQLVELMHNLQLDFVMDKTEEGQTIYRLEPSLEAFVQYEGKKSDSVGPARFNVRQLVRAELEKLRIKKKREAVEQAQAAIDGPKKKPTTIVDDKEKENVNPKKIEEKAAVDFFGRVIVKKAKADRSKGPELPQSILEARKNRASAHGQKFGPDAEEEEEEEEERKVKKLKVFYHYNEGYSNAVRKPVKMSSLLA